MNCPDFKTVIVEIARGRLMDAASRERGLEHVRQCVSCATVLAEERALSRDLRALSVEDPAEEIPDRIETALLAAFRQRAVAQPAVATGNRRRSLAVAAMALLTLGLALARWVTSSAPRESPASGSANVRAVTTPTVAPAPEKTPERSNWPSPPIVVEQQQDRSISGPRSEKRQKRLAVTPANRPPADDIAPREFVTQFFPVIQGADLIPLESGRIVRVRMARSNLIPLGIPFNQERANETIKADVLLSNDGLARAIRLVY